MNANIPNILTISRIALIPLVAWFLWADDPISRWIAFGFYFLASISDFFDGYLARELNQMSALGRMLDPIADKLLVATLIMVLIANGQVAGIHFVAGLVIILREIAISGLREFLGEIQITVPVSKLAKWKTTAQILCLGFLIVGNASNPFPWELLNGITVPSHQIGIILLWLSAGLTLITGINYAQATAKHLD